MEGTLVEKIAKWSQGEFSKDDLFEAVAEAREGLQNHRTGFATVVETLNPRQLEGCGELIEFAFYVLDQMQTNLDLVQSSLDADDRNSVFVAGDAIARATFQLNQTFVAFRHRSLLALGPTEIPTLNNLLDLKGRLIAEPSEQNLTLFMEGLDEERIVTYHALEDLSKEPNLAEVETLIRAFRQHLKNLNEVAKSLDSGPHGWQPESLFDKLNRSFQELSTLVPTVSLALRTQGETDSPDLNYLLSIMTEAGAGSMGDGPILAAIEAVAENYQTTNEALEASLESVDSVLAKEEIEKCLDAFEDLHEGLEAVNKFLEERDRAWLKQGRGYLLDFARRFQESHLKLQEIENQLGKVLCPRCSVYNESDRNRCSSCGSPLPQNVASEPVSTFNARETPQLSEKDELLVTANLAKLYQAINSVSAGEIDHPEFEQALNQFEQILNANVAALPVEPEVKDPEEQELVEMSYDRFETSLSQLHSGLDLLRGYLENPDDETLKDAVKMIDQGAKGLESMAEGAKQNALSASE